MKKMKKLLRKLKLKHIYITFIIFLCILSVFFGLFMHEFSHYRQFELFGCDDIKYEINGIMLHTKADCSNLSPEDERFLNLAISNTESNYEFQRFDLYIFIIIMMMLFKIK